MRVSAAFVKIADTLVADYDVFDLLHTLVEESVGILDAAATGLVLVDPAGVLQVMASTSEESQLVEVLQLEAGTGPCVGCYKSGVSSILPHPMPLSSLLPCLRIPSLHAVPMRLRNRTIGALNLFGHEVGPLSSEDAAIAQAFATWQPSPCSPARESALINDQLRHALNSRILIEQAKGVIAHTSNADMNAAFGLLRGYARAHNQTLYDTAEKVINRRINI